MSYDINEDDYAEQPTLAWLEELGWVPAYGPDISPGGAMPERTDFSEVVLQDRLRTAVRKLNPGLTEVAIEHVVSFVRESTSPDVVLDQQAFHELIFSGVPVSYVDAEGWARDVRARIIDWEHPKKNDFLAVNQFTIIQGQKNRRPDILLFVNGLPLSQIELKGPAREGASAKSAANQVGHYVETVPYLYRFVEFVLVSNVHQARVGTLTTPADHFSVWRAIGHGDLFELEPAVRDLYGKERFLDLVSSFTFFDASSGKPVKIMAKYHQVEAVDKAVESGYQAMRSDQRAGIVWHGQGSGKSYTMVFYVQKLRRDARFRNPTVVCVCDDLDLDQQLYEQFADHRELQHSVKRAESIRNLQELLRVPAGDVIFTTIQKFQPAADQSEMPAISTRENIIVIADEAHRSHYDLFARNITRALPNAIRIGFTGTPVEENARSTSIVFGDYISKYRMSRSQEDGNTVPIYYDSRAIPLSIGDNELLEEVADLVEQEGDETRLKTNRSWARLERAAGSDERLGVLASTIVQHFEARQQTLEGKGMVVCMSRRIASRLTERLQAKLGASAVECVITASADEDMELSRWRRSKEERKEVERRFKDPDSPLKLAVVCNLWLTGFDVPPLHTLYVDKPMRDHGLLQAIGRVNRVFGDKPGGLVIDLIGIGEDLKDALSAYSSDVVSEATVSAAEAVRHLKEKYDVVAEFFYGLDYRHRRELEGAEPLRLLKKALDRVLVSPEEKERFLKESYLLGQWFRLVSADPEVLPLENDIAFFLGVAESVRQLEASSGNGSGTTSPIVEQKMRQFFSKGLTAGAVIDVLQLAGVDRPEISILSEEFLGRIQSDVDDPNLRAGLLKRLLQEEVRTRTAGNRLQAKRFDKAIRDILRKYELQQLTSAEVIARLVEVARELRSLQRRDASLGLSPEEIAFYDAVAGHGEDWQPDPELAAIARDLVKAIRGDLTIDWADRQATVANMRRKVKRILRNRQFQPRPSGGGRPLPLERAVDLILEQAMVLYRRWPEDRSEPPW